MTQHPHDDLEAFVLGDLDPDAASAVMSHADDCPACAATLADMMNGVAALARSDAKAPEPVDLRTRLHNSRQKTAAPRRERATSWWVAVAASAAALVLGAWNLELRATTPQAVPIDALVHSHFIHHPLTGSGGNAKVIQAVDGSWVYLVADGLRPMAAYQLTINGASLGQVTSDVAGRATGYWPRTPSKVTHVELTGPNDSRLEWTGKS
jgi:anti-sigma factor RsiW